MIRYFLFGLAALVLLGAATGCAVNAVSGRADRAPVQLSASQEISLGEKVYPEAIQSLGGEVADPQLQAYVSRVGQALARVSQRSALPYAFTVANDSSPNVFALPGGKIVITRGLLIRLDNEAQLAAVLGNAIGHIVARDPLRWIPRDLPQTGYALLSDATDPIPYGPLARTLASLAATLLDQSYNRDQQLQADRLEIDCMIKAGYDPSGAVQYLEALRHQLSADAVPSGNSGLVQPHPFVNDRLVASQRYIAATYSVPDKGARLGSEDFRQAVAGLEQTRAGYALYEQARREQENGQLGKAIATYLEAATQAPNQALILTGLGLAYMAADDLNSARLNLARAVRLDGNYYFSRLGLGYIYLQLKRYPQALPELERSMRLMPSTQGAFFLAEAYDRNGKPQRALALYHGIASADPQGKLGRKAAALAEVMKDTP